MATLFEIFSRATRDLRPCHYHAVVSTLCSLWWLCLGIMRCGGNSDDPPLRGTMNIAAPPRPRPTTTAQCTPSAPASCVLVIYTNNGLASYAALITTCAALHWVTTWTSKHLAQLMRQTFRACIRINKEIML